MRVSPLWSTLLLLLCMQVDGLSQGRNCGSMEYLEYQKQNDSMREVHLRDIELHTRRIISNYSRQAPEIITLPVVVHIVYNTASENLNDDQIQSQIEVLNEDFRRLNADADATWSQATDSKIQFCLATTDPEGNATNGITRTATSRTSFGTNDQVKFTSSGGKNAWPASDYLNIWVCDISGGVLGYAQFPGGPSSTDGIVVDYQHFGRLGSATAPFNLGRTTTHEVGHYLNLRHIWGDGGCNVDDYVSDTPLSDAPNGGCNIGHISCNSVDMVQNYMDYSDDACMNLFTTGQASRMRALFEPGGARESMLNSAACGPPADPTCDDGIRNGDETGVDCGGSCASACPTCDDGIQNGNETGIDCGGSTCAPCPCLDNEVTLTIVLDSYPEETSWTLNDNSGTVIASGGTYPNQPDGSTITKKICLIDGCYSFRIDDTYGDGICCGYGNGSYTITDAGGNILASGGQFRSSETKSFCVNSNGNAPTCTDGIQNGEETGIDCGGSCPQPCATCEDGVQNGDESGIDCGGACPNACSSCNDGIQNGDETGIDCGGSCNNNCENGSPCSNTVLNSNDFESTWGIWNDGGSDAAAGPAFAAYANSGQSCVRLRDNTSSSVITTDLLDLSTYEEIKVDFSYYAQSMDNPLEDFWLLISFDGGFSFYLVEEWNFGDEFVNDQRMYDSVVIPGPFTSTTRIQFRCDASSNSDWVYLDDITISGCINSGKEVLAGSQKEALSPKTDFEVTSTLPLSNFTLYPNPAKNLLNVSFTLVREMDLKLWITDLTGKAVKVHELKATYGDNETEVDVSQLSPGFYFVHLITADNEMKSKKFVVTR